MKTLLLSFFTFLALGVNAQIDTVLFKSLKNIDPLGEDAQKITTAPSEYLEWLFDNCYYMEDESMWVQVASSKTSGTLTTPELKGLTGNGRITIQVYGRDDKTAIVVSPVGDGDVTPYSRSLANKDIWYRLNPFLLRGGNEKTKLRFSSIPTSGTGVKRFRIANVLVCDMADNIYQETFDKMNAAGGNDGDFVVTDWARPTAVISNLDYVGSSLYDFKQAKCCLLASGTAGSPSTLTTATIPLQYFSGNKVFMSFRHAGIEGYNPTVEVLQGVKSCGTVKAKSATWKTDTVEITNIVENMTITLKGNDYFLDDIRVWEVGYMADDADNTDALSHTTVENIMLNRTLGAGYWNTLCLPFDFSLEGELPEEMKGRTVELMHLTDVQDGVFVFTPTTSVSAGEPFLIRVSETVTNPTFRHVQVTQPTPVAKTFGDYQMVGAYSPVDLNTDGTHLFLGSDGELYCPTDEDYTMNGLRAYFVVPGGSSARVMVSEDPMTVKGIQHMGSSEQEGTYDLMGRRIGKIQRQNGIYIEKGKKRAW